MPFLHLPVEEAIRHPNFSHARAGNGCWRDSVRIYHRDPTSPSGVMMVSSGDASEVDSLLRAIRNTSALSPTEGLYRPGMEAEGR